MATTELLHQRPSNIPSLPETHANTISSTISFTLPHVCLLLGRAINSNTMALASSYQAPNAPWRAPPPCRAHPLPSTFPPVKQQNMPEFPSSSMLPHVAVTSSTNTLLRTTHPNPSHCITLHLMIVYPTSASLPQLCTNIGLASPSLSS